ncbi:MAG: hypothetical protein WCB31_10020 [Nitrososphaeraceae archaeon]
MQYRQYDKQNKEQEIERLKKIISEQTIMIDAFEETLKPEEKVTSGQNNIKERYDGH